MKFPAVPRTLLLAGIVASAMLMPTAGHALTIFEATPSSIAPAQLGTTVPIELFFESTGDPVLDAVFGWDVRIEAFGGITFDTFIPVDLTDDGIEDVVFSLTPMLLRANGGDAINGEFGRFPYGVLNLIATGAGEIRLSGLFVDGGLDQALEIPLGVIFTAVPEPSSTTMIGIGLSVVALSRGRFRRQ